MRRTLIAALTAAATVGLAACQPGDMDPLARKFMVYDACKDAVTQQLKAPASADFPSNTDVDYSMSGDNVTITAYVDAENGFGAKIRTRWACTGDVDAQGHVSGVQAMLAGG